MSMCKYAVHIFWWFVILNIFLIIYSFTPFLYLHYIITYWSTCCILGTFILVGKSNFNGCDYLNHIRIQKMAFPFYVHMFYFLEQCLNKEFKNIPVQTAILKYLPI